METNTLKPVLFVSSNTESIIFGLTDESKKTDQSEIEIVRFEPCGEIYIDKKLEFVAPMLYKALMRCLYPNKSSE